MKSEENQRKCVLKWLHLLAVWNRSGLTNGGALTQKGWWCHTTRESSGQDSPLHRDTYKSYTHHPHPQDSKGETGQHFISHPPVCNRAPMGVERNNVMWLSLCFGKSFFFFGEVTCFKAWCMYAISKQLLWIYYSCWATVPLKIASHSWKGVETVVPKLLIEKTSNLI